MYNRHDYSDRELLERMLSSDKEAFTAIYHRYWERLFLTAVKVLRSKEDAADIVQDVFLSLWNRRTTLTIESSIEAYLQTSIRYKAIHYIEKNITRRDYLAMLTDTEANDLSAGAETQLQFKQVQQVIRQTVEQMPPKMRAVYQLSRQEELTHKEIASRLGISDETVKKHIQHALQLIKTALGNSSASLGALIIILLK